MVQNRTWKTGIYINRKTGGGPMQSSPSILIHLLLQGQ